MVLVLGGLDFVCIFAPRHNWICTATATAQASAEGLSLRFFCFKRVVPAGRRAVFGAHIVGSIPTVSITLFLYTTLL